jgi:hypothetical protein
MTWATVPTIKRIIEGRRSVRSHATRSVGASLRALAALQRYQLTNPHNPRRRARPAGAHALPFLADYQSPSMPTASWWQSVFGSNRISYYARMMNCSRPCWRSWASIGGDIGLSSRCGGRFVRFVPGADTRAVCAMGERESLSAGLGEQHQSPSQPAHMCRFRALTDSADRYGRLFHRGSGPHLVRERTRNGAKRREAVSGRIPWCAEPVPGKPSYRCRAETDS